MGDLGQIKPEIVTTQLLLSLMKMAEVRCGVSPLRKAVVTVPDYFSED